MNDQNRSEILGVLAENLSIDIIRFDASFITIVLLLDGETIASVTAPVPAYEIRHSGD